MLGSLPHPVPPFSLYHDAFIKILRGNEAKIKFLRSVANATGAEYDTLIIRVCTKTHSSTKAADFQYISAVTANNPFETSEYIRWVDGEEIESAKARLQGRVQVRFETLPDCSVECLPESGWFRWYDPPSFFRDPPFANDPENEEANEAIKPDTRPGLWSWLWGGQNINQNVTESITNQSAKRVLTFRPIYGDADGAAIFQRVDRPEVQFSNAGLNLGIIAERFDSLEISSGAFYEHVANLPNNLGRHVAQENGHQEEDVVTSLQFAATAAMIYDKFKNATIALDVIRCGPLCYAQYGSTVVREHARYALPFEKGGSLLPFILSRNATFSCIGFFESGGFQISPEYLDNVMALSVGNSIYVAAPLLCDPSINPRSDDVRRILGNIGRSGLAFMFPPAAPKLKGWDVSSFQVVRHDVFDGQALDCFQNTSLHLGFSGYESPINVGSHGGRYTEAYFLESIVSVHDRGEWIADLDMLGMFDGPLFHCLEEQPTCKSMSAGGNPRLRLVAIDSWKELLDKPADVAVVRAHGNWLGRLAAAAVSVSLGLPTVVFCGEGCWECGQKVLVSMPLTNGVPLYPIFIL